MEKSGESETFIGGNEKFRETGVPLTYGSIRIYVDQSLIDDVRADVMSASPEERREVMDVVLGVLEAASELVHLLLNNGDTLPEELMDHIADNMLLRHVLMSC